MQHLLLGSTKVLLSSMENTMELNDPQCARLIEQKVELGTQKNWLNIWVVVSLHV